MTVNLRKQTKAYGKEEDYGSIGSNLISASLKDENVK
jgi:hypothetical protein